MKPPNFRYAAARSIEEALELLASHGEEAQILAGGQSLVQRMIAREVHPPALVDVNGVDGLAFVAAHNGTMAIGALTRTAAVERDATVAERATVLREAAGRVGHPAVRNRGTVGGNLAHADPANNLPAVMLALDATLAVRGPDGEREVAAADFFRGPYRTAISPGEMLVEIHVPALAPGAGSAHLEISRRRRGWGLAGVATVVALDEAGAVADARIALSSLGPVPVRVAAAERLLHGQLPSDDLFAAAAGAVRDAVTDPPSDVHGSADYRRHLAGVLTRRALATATTRAGGTQ